ncbi:MAG: phosphoglucomutase/phosphomannomutase family protein [Cyanobacteria bacterium NC_groundwater_1444_Ag_S-0.65um_54_12]|nr:phosphoglucomutase/phosphomannomutase family protein [Cyanobacteria bacterium NC_groundwater_1444_Ag_S-0.65um_54_12]
MQDTITFGTDGWRAVIAEEFTFTNVRRVATALANYILKTHGTERPVMIGHDTRFLARDFARTVAYVLQYHGLSTLAAEHAVPTPVIAFAAREAKSAGAVMITASHNPPQYCGIKYIPEYGGPATKAITDLIVAELADVSLADLAIGMSDGQLFDPSHHYRAAILALLDTERLRRAQLRVAYDAMHATGSGYTDSLLGNVGCEVTVLHANPDPLFGGVMPEPTAHYLEELAQTVKKNGLILGLANDGDADRFGVIGEDGRYYSPNQIIPMLARHLHHNRQLSGAIVRTVATTHLLDRIAERYGLPLREVPVGFKWVGALMRQEPVLIGGEESGGLSILGHIPEKDGILADLLVAEMVAWERKPLSQIWQELLTEMEFEAANCRMDLRLNAADKQTVMDFFSLRTPATIAGRPVCERNTGDGVKLLLAGEAWLLARPSGTEPLIRIYLEAASWQELQELQQAVTELVASITQTTLATSSSYAHL